MQKKNLKKAGIAGVSIRRAALADKEQIIGNWKELMEQSERYHPASNKRKENYVEIYRRFLARQIKGRKSAVFVAEKGGRIIGHLMIEIKLIPPVYEIDEEGFVDELFVQKESRRLGIGTMLLEEGEKWARKKGMKQFSLHTNVKNFGALNAYKNFGLESLIVKLVKPL